MDLHLLLSLNSFVSGLSQPSLLTVPALNLVNEAPEESIYGLDLFRRGIEAYEEAKGITVPDSKRAIPFFRENRRMLVGAEVEMYALSLYEGDKDALPTGSDLIVTFDYARLAEHCLTEIISLLRCSYNEAANLQWYVEQLDKEYDKFFYDDEYTGFTRDSGFFSLLCNACLKMQPSCRSEEKEWKMVCFCPPEEAEYGYIQGRFSAYHSFTFPVDCIRQIEMPRREERIAEFSALAGFLQSKGLSPERLVEGLLE